MAHIQLDIFHSSYLKRLSHMKHISLVLISFSSQAVFLICSVLVLITGIIAAILYKQYKRYSITQKINWQNHFNVPRIAAVYLMEPQLPVGVNDFAAIPAAVQEWVIHVLALNMVKNIPFQLGHLSTQHTLPFLHRPIHNAGHVDKEHAVPFLGGWVGPSCPWYNMII